MTDSNLRVVGAFVTNLGAVLGGITGAWLFGFTLPWSLLVAPLAGTLGWFLGALMAAPLVRWLRAHRYAPAGQSAYRLKDLPPNLISAGGKARSLAAMLQAGHPVPPGLVLLPDAFEGEAPDASSAQWLQSQLKRLGPTQRFAVRSSALAEDSGTASFAGAYETVLDVSAEQVSQAIAQVRRSRQAERVDAYAKAAGAEGVGEVAVVVQVMVAAQRAGVLFTVHPLTRELNTMLGSVVTGLGESLVSGAENGTEFTLGRPDATYTGPADLKPHAKRIHDLAHAVEGTFAGVPQDIEWAIAADKLWILQARPITTLNAVKQRTAEINDSLAGNCLWSATNLSEANPVPQTPLTISYLRYLQANGGPTMAIRGREMAGSIGGRPYANLSVQITARRGRSKADPARVYRNLAGWWGALPPAAPLALVPMTKTDWQQAGLPLLGTVVKLAKYRRQLPRYLAENPARCADLARRIATAQTPCALLQLWQDALFSQALLGFWMTIAAGSEGPAKLEGELRQRYDAEVVADLMGNSSGLAGRLESLGPAVGLQEVLNHRLSAAEYQESFGHRGVNETELAWPRPAEDPEWLAVMLSTAAAGADLSGLTERRRTAYDAALATVRAHDGRAAARVARQLLRAARQAAAREAARSEGVRGIWITRRFALRAGELLNLGEAVFYLTLPELLDALGGQTGAFEYLAERQLTHQRYLQLPALPAVIYGAFEPFEWAADPNRRGDFWMPGREPEDPAAASAELISGYAGAAGRVEGVVRRLDNFDQADELRAGEILVTHLTNIGWTTVFPIVAAVVTDLGAPLSHAAIVARELGVPAVVGCGDATERLRTGDRVLVDGARGEVRLLSRAEG